MMDLIMKRGEIFFAALDPTRGSEIHPFEVKLGTHDSGLSKDSKAMAQQVRTIDKARLGSLRKGSASAVKMRQVDDALRLHLAL